MIVLYIAGGVVIGLWLFGALANWSAPKRPGRAFPED